MICGTCILFFCSVSNFRLRQYPSVRDNIQGEEAATFSNALGETVDLTLTDNQENTINLLVKILNGDNDAAAALADEVHRNVLCADAGIENIPDLVNFVIFHCSSEL